MLPGPQSFLKSKIILLTKKFPCAQLQILRKLQVIEVWPVSYHFETVFRDFQIFLKRILQIIENHFRLQFFYFSMDSEVQHHGVLVIVVRMMCLGSHSSFQKLRYLRFSISRSRKKSKYPFQDFRDFENFYFKMVRNRSNFNHL